ncbi:MAG: winged helix-turn-helix domain-containing protein [Thermoleophilia bacterium]|jgi:molybdate transport system regulatory protein
MKLDCKIWLEYRGRAFGDGPARLLDGVRQMGSLRKAAAELGMSYNKAWRILNAAEKRLGFSLLDRSVGGASGGGSRLTPQAEDLSVRYRGLMADATQAMEVIFERHFGDWKDPLPEDATPDGDTQDGNTQD